MNEMRRQMKVTDTGTGIMVLNVDEVTTTVVSFICFDSSVEYIDFFFATISLELLLFVCQFQIQSKGANDQPAGKWE